MKYEDYEALAAGVTADNTPAILKEMLDNMKQDLSERDTLLELRDTQEARIRDLQDTNMKLFLSQTGEAQEDEQTEEEKVEEMTLEEYLDYVKKESEE